MSNGNGQNLFRYYGNILSMSQAGPTSDGWLSQVDWNRFNNAAPGTLPPVQSVFGRIGNIAANPADYAAFYEPGLGVPPADGYVLSSTASGTRIWVPPGSSGISGGYPFNVKNYGAVGDSVANDTGAIQAALAAIPAGGGVLYFPAGTYNYTGSPLVLAKPVTVLGDGGGTIRFTDFADGTDAISRIEFDSATGTLFDVQVAGCGFYNIGFRNTTVATAGSAVVESGGGNAHIIHFTKYHHVSISGFFIGIDIQEGGMQRIDGSLFYNQGQYAVKIRNIGYPDSGDICISDSTFLGLTSSPAAIRIESGGGPKIINSKIIQYLVGIDLAVDPGIETSDLLICNNSIEAVTVAGIRGMMGAGAKWRNTILTANQFLCYGSTPYGIIFDGTGGAEGFVGLAIIGNYGTVGGSSNSFIDLTSIQNLVTAGNSQYGFASPVVNTHANVTFAVTDAVRSQPTYPTPTTMNQAVACLQAAMLSA